MHIATGYKYSELDQAMCDLLFNLDTATWYGAGPRADLSFECFADSEPCDNTFMDHKYRSKVHELGVMESFNSNIERSFVWTFDLDK